MKTRLKIALFFITCLQAGFSFAEYYYWDEQKYVGYSPSKYRSSDPNSVFKKWGLDNPETSKYSHVYQRHSTVNGAPSYKAGLVYNSNPDVFYKTIYIARGGDSCPPGTNYDPVTGECSEPSIPQCEAGKKIASTDYSAEAGLNLTQVCYQDCAYERKGVFEDWQSGKTYTGFWGTGSTCRQAEVDEPIKGNPDENPVYEGVCNVIGDLIICPDTEVTPPDPQPDPNPPYCFELNGQRECYEPGMTCGYVNDKWACVPDAPEATPNCTYVNGAEICINPNDKKPIPEDSPDHPANGGNGDGDNTNDPQDPRPKTAFRSEPAKSR